MKREAQVQFKTESWEETPWLENDDGSKLTIAIVEKSYGGDFKGSGKLRYLIAHDGRGGAEFHGYEQMEGKLFDKQGSFVVKHDGVFESGVAKYEWHVIESSSKGELVGISGEGEFALPHQESYDEVFTFDLPE